MYLRNVQLSWEPEITNLDDALFGTSLSMFAKKAPKYASPEFHPRVSRKLLSSYIGSSESVTTCSLTYAICHLKMRAGNSFGGVG